MSYWWLRPLQATAKGAAITLGSTVVSCGIATQVEKNTNRLFFYMAPHWYANVEQAYGITDEQLASVRHLRRKSDDAMTMGNSLQPRELASSSRWSTTAPSASSSSSALSFSTETKFVIAHERNPDASASASSSSKTKVVVIPLGDVLSNALTG
jgi:hypothetical protein